MSFARSGRGTPRFCQQSGHVDGQVKKLPDELSVNVA